MFWLIAAGIGVIAVAAYVAWKRRRDAYDSGWDDAMDGFVDEDEPRPHHYLFAHRLLPMMVFHADEPLVRLCTPDTLHELWETAGEAAAEQGAAQLPSEGLSVRAVDVGGSTGALLRLPMPRAALEAALALVVREGAGVRYFVLEKQGDYAEDPGLGVVCEWRQDGSRANFGATCSLYDGDAFRSAVASLLHGGGRPAAETDLGADAGGDFDALGADEPLGTLRYRPCVFAFHVLPEVISVVGVPAEADDIDDFTARAWLQAEQRCAAARLDRDVEIDPPRAHAAVAAGARCVIVAIDDPHDAPEPGFVALLDEPRAGARIFTLERGSRGDRAVVATVALDGRHNVVGAANEMSEAALLGAIEALAGEGALAEPRAAGAQRQRYADIVGALRLGN